MAAKSAVDWVESKGARLVDPLAERSEWSWVDRKAVGTVESSVALSVPTKVVLRAGMRVELMVPRSE